MEEEFVRERYDMSKKKFCLIITNFEFVKSSEYLPGHIDDAKRLDNDFSSLGFQVVKRNNLNANDINQTFKALSKNEELLNELSILVCVILSHGKTGVVFGTDNEPVRLNTIFGYFEGNNCKALIGKPKVFFVDACRGGNVDYGVPNVAAGGSNLPKTSDFLKAYATVNGYVSWMDGIDGTGSWYIYELCKKLKESARFVDLLSILTVVNNKVATDHQSTDGEVQQPIFESTLRKALYLETN